MILFILYFDIFCGFFRVLWKEIFKLEDLVCYELGMEMVILF